MGRLATHLPGTQTLLYAATGVLAAIGGIASAHLVAGLTNPAASPVLAVGSVVIDATPTPIKEYAVAQFGTADKPILLASVTLVTLLAAAVAGALSRRRVGLGVGFIVLLTGLATAAAATRTVAVPSDAFPGVVAAIVGLAILFGLSHASTGNGVSTPDDPNRSGSVACQHPTGCYDIRQGRGVLDQAGLGHGCPHQDVLSDRHPSATVGDQGRYDGHRRCRLGPAGRHPHRRMTRDWH